MTPDLFSQEPSAADVPHRALSPECELGAYEALCARWDTGFKSIAEAFGTHPVAIPSDFVPKAETEKDSRVTLASIRNAGIQHFGVRIHGTADYPARRFRIQHEANPSSPGICHQYATSGCVRRGHRGDGSSR